MNEKSSCRRIAYLGCRTTLARQGRGRGLSVYGIDDVGNWTLIQNIGGLVNPSFLCMDTTQSHLYAVHGDFSEISSFSINPHSGILRQTGQQETGGRNPVHLTLSRSQKWLLVANYATGNVVSLPVKTDGTLGSRVFSLDLIGQAGPHADQHGSHPHQICVDPTGHWILVPDKGLDTVFTLTLNESTGQLKIVGKTKFPGGCGPRHMIFHPHVLQAYVVGELDRTVMTCAFNPVDGSLTLKEVMSTVPSKMATGSTAGITISQNGKYLHVSNRGHDSVASYLIDEKTGGLSSCTWTSCAGRTPRFIDTTRDGQSLIVANEDSDALAKADIGISADAMTFQPILETGSPVCIVFKELLN